MRQLEDDLLLGHDRGSSPFGKGCFGRGNSRFQLFVCRLGNTGDEVVRSRVVEVDPLRSLGGDELIVNEVVGVDDILNLLVGGRIVGDGGTRGREMLGGGMKPSLCDMLVWRHSESRRYLGRCSSGRQCGESSKQ